MLLMQSAMFMLGGYALSVVLTWLCTVLSPITTLSSRSNFISQALNNQLVLLGSGFTKLSVDNKEEILLQPPVILFRTHAEL